MKEAAKVEEEKVLSMRSCEILVGLYQFYNEAIMLWKEFKEQF